MISYSHGHVRSRNSSNGLSSFSTRMFLAQIFRLHDENALDRILGAMYE